MKDIISGKIDIAELDRQEEEREKINKAKEEIKEKEKRARLLQGTPGKGH